MKSLRARSVLALIGLASVVASTALAAEMRAVISHFDGNNVSILDVAEQRVEATVPVAPKPKRLAAGAISTGTAKQTWSFDKDPTRRLTAGWAAVTGTWQVVADSTAPSPPNVLAQASKGHTGSYFSVAIANEPSSSGLWRAT